MDDQVLMRMGDGRQHVQKQSNTRIYVEAEPIAVDIDGFTVDVLKH